MYLVTVVQTITISRAEAGLEKLPWASVCGDPKALPNFRIIPLLKLRETLFHKPGCVIFIFIFFSKVAIKVLWYSFLFLIFYLFKIESGNLICFKNYT